MIIFYSGSSFSNVHPEKYLSDVAVMATYYEILNKLYHQRKRFKEIVKSKKDKQLEEK